VGVWRESVVPFAAAARPIAAADIAAAEAASVESNHFVARMDGAVEARPTPAQRALAQEFYGLGVHGYWSREYASAVDQLTQACRLDPNDARPWYFRGLAEQALGKREAALASFAMATRLVASGTADRHALAKALERVQGSQRMLFLAAVSHMHRSPSMPVAPRQPEGTIVSKEAEAPNSLVASGK
jgi:tetratricopeptide (TPR) repeat protein